MTNTDIAARGRFALLLGATGLVGGHCLRILLDSERYAVVRVLARRPIDLTHPRLEQRIIDFGDFDVHPELFRVNDVFCCLGTTIRKAGSQEAFRRVDVEYPVEAARLACDAGADQFLVVSALGAEVDSRVFYNRAKGEMEARLRRLPFQAIWILRPALLLGVREERRLGERVAETLIRPMAPLLVGPLRRLRPVQARDVAAAMVALASQDGTGGVVESEEIAELAESLEF